MKYQRKHNKERWRKNERERAKKKKEFHFILRISRFHMNKSHGICQIILPFIKSFYEENIYMYTIFTIFTT